MSKLKPEPIFKSNGLSPYSVYTHFRSYDCYVVPIYAKTAKEAEEIVARMSDDEIKNKGALKNKEPEVKRLESKAYPYKGAGGRFYNDDSVIDKERWVAEFKIQVRGQEQS
jgi:hypothetical protein